MTRKLRPRPARNELTSDDEFIPSGPLTMISSSRPVRKSKRSRKPLARMTETFFRSHSTRQASERATERLHDIDMDIGPQDKVAYTWTATKPKSDNKPPRKSSPISIPPMSSKKNYPAPGLPMPSDASASASASDLMATPAFTPASSLSSTGGMPRWGGGGTQVLNGVWAMGNLFLNSILTFRTLHGAIATASRSRSHSLGMPAVLVFFRSTVDLDCFLILLSFLFPSLLCFLVFFVLFSSSLLSSSPLLGVYLFDY